MTFSYLKPPEQTVYSLMSFFWILGYSSICHTVLFLFHHRGKKLFNGSGLWHHIVCYIFVPCIYIYATTSAFSIILFEIIILIRQITLTSVMYRAWQNACKKKKNPPSNLPKWAVNFSLHAFAPPSKFKL